MFLYIFLAIAFILNVVAYDSTISFYAIGTAVLVFAAFYLLYKTGQLGGADAYIMTALALLLPIQPKGLLLIAQPSFLSLPFILDIILASGISFMLYMLVRSIPVAFGSLKLPGKL
jgi:Flp pilus assembly protein protease CpaA